MQVRHLQFTTKSAPFTTVFPVSGKTVLYSEHQTRTGLAEHARCP